MSDQLSLTDELRQIDLEADLELVFAIRKSKRPRRQTAARKGWKTRRSVGSLFNEGVAA